MEIVRETLFQLILSVQVLDQQNRGGWGVQTLADFADAGGWGVRNLEKCADVILERSLT